MVPALGFFVYYCVQSLTVVCLDVLLGLPVCVFYWLVLFSSSCRVS